MPARLFDTRVGMRSMLSCVMCVVRASAKATSDADIADKKRALLHTYSSVIHRKKRIAIAKKKLAVSSQTQSSGWGLGGWLGSAIGSASGHTENVEALETENAALEDISKAVFFELHDMVTENLRTKALTTLKGRYFHIAGHFLSGYCVYKIFMALINIVFNRIKKKDPVTRGFEIAVHWCVRVRPHASEWA